MQGEIVRRSIWENGQLRVLGRDWSQIHERKVNKREGGAVFEGLYCLGCPLRWTQVQLGVQVKNGRRVVNGEYIPNWSGRLVSGRAAVPRKHALHHCHPLSLSLCLWETGRGIVATRIHSHQHHWVQDPRGRERGLQPCPLYSRNYRAADSHRKVLGGPILLDKRQVLLLSCEMFSVASSLWGECFVFFSFFSSSAPDWSSWQCCFAWITGWSTEGSINCILGFKGALQGGGTSALWAWLDPFPLQKRVQFKKIYI